MRGIWVLLVTVFLFGCSAVASVAGKTEERQLSEFERIEVGGLVNVVLVKGTSPKAKVKAFGIDIEDIITEVSDGVLTVTTRGFHSGEAILVMVNYTKLSGIKTAGSATIGTDGEIVSDHLDVWITDSADADLEVNVGRLSARMEDSGNLRLTGHAERQSIVSNGSAGSLNNAGLQVSKE